MWTEVLTDKQRAYVAAFMLRLGYRAEVHIDEFQVGGWVHIYVCVHTYVSVCKDRGWIWRLHRLRSPFLTTLAATNVFATQAYSLTEPANFFGTDMSEALEALLPLRQLLATG